RDALVAADPADAEVFRQNATSYLAKLEVLDGEGRQGIGQIPENRRRMISTHDAFGYFAVRYGIDFIAPVGVSTEAEPSARDIAKIIAQVKAERIPAVFLGRIGD